MNNADYFNHMAANGYSYTHLYIDFNISCCIILIMN